MATRSPNYPFLSLEMAIEEIRKVHRADMRNRMSRQAVATHLGYLSLSGPALGKLAALKAYGFLEGRGDELRVSHEAVIIIADDKSSKERQHAIRNAALRPKLFRELYEYYEGRRPSEANLRSELIKRDFTERAINKIIAVYLVTIDLVTSEGSGYDSVENETGKAPDMAATQEQTEDWVNPLAGAIPIDMPSTTAPSAGNQTNQIKVLLDHDRLQISGTNVDASGIAKLKKMLTKYEEILQLQAGEEKPN